MIHLEFAKIYKIFSSEDDSVYIGSTCQYLHDRLDSHFRDLRAFQSGKKRYVSSFALLGKNGCQISIIEDYPCSTRKELLERENYWIKSFGEKAVNIRLALKVT